MPQSARSDRTKRHATVGTKKDLRTQSNGEREASVIARATEVIGNEKNALRWMGTPVRALDYATPISLLHSVKGRNAVLAVLTRIEHGVL